MAKKPLPDESIRLLKTALRTKLGISAGKPKKAKPKRKDDDDEDDQPAPKKQKVERYGYADTVGGR